MTGSLVILSLAGQSGGGGRPVLAVTVEGFSESDRREVRRHVSGSWRTVVAALEGVELVNPAPDTTLIGFHEAAGPGPLALIPAYVVEDHNAGRSKPAPVASVPDEGALEIVVLPSRGRGAGATTAVDVAVPEGRPILSPVTGTVLTVDRYVLYGQHEDHIIRIAPDDREDVAVKLVHLVGPEVAPGDRVEAGRSRLAAGAKRFGFPSQIDRFTEERGAGTGPHVHIEVEPLEG